MSASPVGSRWNSAWRRAPQAGGSWKGRRAAGRLGERRCQIGAMSSTVGLLIVLLQPATRDVESAAVLHGSGCEPAMVAPGYTQTMGFAPARCEQRKDGYDHAEVRPGQLNSHGSHHLFLCQHPSCVAHSGQEQSPPLEGCLVEVVGSAQPAGCGSEAPLTP